MSCSSRCWEPDGPWITVDPSCPIHGDDRAQMRQEQEDLVLSLIQQIVDAVTAHPQFQLLPDDTEGPVFQISRLGAKAMVRVRHAGRRNSKGHNIHGDGHNVEDATKDLIAGLDHWAAALA